MSSVDFDDVLLHIGERGRYQNIMYYILVLPATIPAVFLVFGQIFLSATPDHWCRVPELEGSPWNLSAEQQREISVPLNSNGKYSQCTMYKVNWTDTFSVDKISMENPRNNSWEVIPCQYGWNYDKTDYDRTLVTQMDLVCDDSWWPSTCTTFFYVGSLFGNVFYGWIADKWGRRTSFFAILVLHVPLAIGTAFSPNYVVYTVLRTINGFAFPAIYQIPFILALELMGPSQRSYAGMVICMLFGSSMALLALLGYLLRDWFLLALITSIPSVFLFSYYWIIPESPRWLLSKNRVEEAEVIVQEMARVNKRPIPPNFLQRMELEQQLLRKQKRGSIVPATKLTNATPLDLLRYPNLRKKYIILVFVWVANAVVYNGLSYNTTNLGVSDYLAFFISGVVEIPSNALAWYAMDRWGRRWTLCVTMLVGGVACVSCMFVNENYVWVTVALAMVGKFGVGSSFSVFYLFVGELLPTVVRSQAMGLASFIAGIGLLGFPYIVYTAVYIRVLPLIVMGLLSVAGALASVFLPETVGAPLPQTLEEGEEFGADDKVLTCPTKRRRSKVDEHQDIKYRLTSSSNGTHVTTTIVETVGENYD